MIEERLTRLKNEIKDTKASMPIAGSLLDTYFYSKTDSEVYIDNTTGTYKVRFIPTLPDEGLGMTDMYTYCEVLASNAPWSQYNPVQLFIREGGYVDSNTEYVYEDDFTASGFGNFTLRITAAVYSTVPGHIEIEFS